MCIAIFKPADVEIPDDHFRNSFINNPDGAGYAYPLDGSVVIKKGFMDFDSFLASYRQDVQVSTPALIHFRITTRGATDPENCHPFALAHGALIHNGTIMDLGDPAGTGRSDTAEFAADVIHTLSPAQLEAARPMIEDYIGWSKLALLFHDGTHLIFNENKGVTFNGAWYSNDGFKEFSRYAGTAFPNRSRYDLSDDYYTSFDGQRERIPQQGRLTSLAIPTDEEEEVEEQVDYAWVSEDKVMFADADGHATEVDAWTLAWAAYDVVTELDEKEDAAMLAEIDAHLGLLETEIGMRYPRTDTVCECLNALGNAGAFEYTKFADTKFLTAMTAAA